VKRYGMAVIGAGPAGLSAAAEAASYGVDTIVFDENSRPGGQLFKQIHRFFGSKEHKAKIRGFTIGKQLLEEAVGAGAQIELDSAVIGIYPHKTLCVMKEKGIYTCKADNIVIATGATENSIAFPGWTLPGVMGAGAAQTLMNLHGVKPGERIVMIGSGNVGLVVGMQLLQAGCKLIAIVDVSPRIGGYGVHASKIARIGVPFYLGYTITEARGVNQVESVVLSKVGKEGLPVMDTEIELEADTVCLAVGLSPMYQLAMASGCKLMDLPEKGGVHPITDEYGQTTVAGIYAAGDAAGIEEATSAMVCGRIAGAAIACREGYLSMEAHRQKHAAYINSLDCLRQGMFSGKNKNDPGVSVTDEGIPPSLSLLRKGYLEEKELAAFPGYLSNRFDYEGFRPVIECTQNIPCDPCRDICPNECIIMGGRITGLPEIRPEAECTACGLCVSMCPGQAVFLVNKHYCAGYAAVTLPYEFLPIPETGEKGTALDRSGKAVCYAEVISAKTSPAFDHTAVLTIKIPVDMAGSARFFVSDANKETAYA